MLVAAIVGLVLCGVVSDMIGAVHHRKRGFLWGFFLGPVGWLIMMRTPRLGELRDFDDPLRAPELAIAAWHPDPFGRFHARWWDGSHWTAEVTNLAPDGSMAHLADPV